MYVRLTDFFKNPPLTFIKLRIYIKQGIKPNLYQQQDLHFLKANDHPTLVNKLGVHHNRLCKNFYGFSYIYICSKIFLSIQPTIIIIRTIICT